MSSEHESSDGPELDRLWYLPAFDTVDAAAGAFVAMDRACQSQLLAEAAGDPIDIGDDVARHTYSTVGSGLAMWFTFQPLYTEIVREQPDLLD